MPYGPFCPHAYIGNIHSVNWCEDAFENGTCSRIAGYAIIQMVSVAGKVLPLRVHIQNGRPEILYCRSSGNHTFYGSVFQNSLRLLVLCLEMGLLVIAEIVYQGLITMGIRLGVHVPEFDGMSILVL